MNDSLNILNNHNETFENDFCIINLITEHVTWKPMMFNPKLSNNIRYWFNERKNLNF